jgi:hypothetical protein
MRSHDAVVERLPQIAGVRAAWSWLCTGLVTDEVPLGEPTLCNVRYADITYDIDRIRSVLIE